MRAFCRALISIIGIVAIGACRAAPPPKAAELLYAQDRCGPASGKWSPQGSELGELMMQNVLEVGQHEIRWNKTLIALTKFRKYLGELHALNPSPNLVVVFDPAAKCSIVSETRQMIAADADCGNGHVCVEYSAVEWEKIQPPAAPRSTAGAR